MVVVLKQRHLVSRKRSLSWPREVWWKRCKTALTSPSWRRCQAIFKIWAVERGRGFREPVWVDRTAAPNPKLGRHVKNASRVLGPIVAREQVVDMTRWVTASLAILAVLERENRSQKASGDYRF